MLGRGAALSADGDAGGAGGVPGENGEPVAGPWPRAAAAPGGEGPPRICSADPTAPHLQGEPLHRRAAPAQPRPYSGREGCFLVAFTRAAFLNVASPRDGGRSSFFPSSSSPTVSNWIRQWEVPHGDL